MPNLLQISDLDATSIIHILKRANEFQTQAANRDIEQVLTGKSIFNVFFEGSTRTRMAFEVATKMLGGFAFNLDVVSSSVKKGESLIDTIHTLSEMYMDVMVVRHGTNNTPKIIEASLPPHIGLVNAGDGTRAHPTQALLDLMTMLQVSGNIEMLRTKKIVIIGDIQHSRVAKSLLKIFDLMHINNVTICGPNKFLPEAKELKLLHPKVVTSTTLEEGISGQNFIIALRLQKERIHQEYLVDEDQLIKDWGINAEKLKMAAPEHWIMHPGPILRGIDVGNDIADASNSLIRRQVHNGLAVRMATLEMAINH